MQCDIADLHPNTRRHLAKFWEANGPRLSPKDFSMSEASFTGYFVHSPSLGDGVLREEASLGRDPAHREWWDIQHAVALTPDEGERVKLLTCLQELESIWGNLST